MLEIGKIMVHKAHGICEIKDILKIGDLDYYKLVPNFDCTMSIFVPFAKENELLRPVLKIEEAEDLISYMRSIDDSVVEDSKERRDLFHKMLIESDLKKIAYMYFKLYLLRRAKNEQNTKFCLTDSVMLEKLYNILFMELAIVYNKSKDEIYDYILKKVGTNVIG